jgi:hypothetical protein
VNLIVKVGKNVNLIVKVGKNVNLLVSDFMLLGQTLYVRTKDKEDKAHRT